MIFANVGICPFFGEQVGERVIFRKVGGAERLKRGEEAADDHPSIGLHHGGKDRVVGAGIKSIMGGGGGGGDREGHGRGARATGAGDRNIARGGAGRDDGGEGQIGYDGDNVPFVCGSALCAMEGTKPEIGILNILILRASAIYN